ncbi:MAG TPA: hypothetical protein PKM73_01975 [Verrucomicrobiota bacterium]|nr:hypothetical protein [Verrucomicrobiota bacterium]HNU50319.1 hypothetical protein [Verrucomicrobiota bacterium]
MNAAIYPTEPRTLSLESSPVRMRCIGGRCCIELEDGRVCVVEGAPHRFREVKVLGRGSLVGGHAGSPAALLDESGLSLLSAPPAAGDTSSVKSPLRIPWALEGQRPISLAATGAANALVVGTDRWEVHWYRRRGSAFRRVSQLTADLGFDVIRNRPAALYVDEDTCLVAGQQSLVALALRSDPHQPRVRPIAGAARLLGRGSEPCAIVPCGQGLAVIAGDRIDWLRLLAPEEAPEKLARWGESTACNLPSSAAWVEPLGADMLLVQHGLDGKATDGFSFFRAGAGISETVEAGYAAAVPGAPSEVLVVDPEALVVGLKPRVHAAKDEWLWRLVLDGLSADSSGVWGLCADENGLAHLGLGNALVMIGSES